MVILVLDSLLASSLARISNERQAMFSGGSKGVQGSDPGAGSDSVSKRELNAAYLILVMASLPLLIYIPNALCWFPFVVSSLVPNWNSQVSTLLAVLGRVTLSLTSVVHFWNLFLYSFRVTGFLQEIVRIITCGLVRPAFIASQSSGLHSSPAFVASSTTEK